MPENSITVVGHGSASAEPDEALINLGVTVFKPLAAAIAEGNRRMAQVLKALLDAGVAQHDLKTKSFEVHRRDQGRDQKSDAATLYMVTSLLALRVRNIDDLSRLMGIAIDAGVDHVSQLRFDSSRRDSLLNEARLAAVADARATADLLAAALDRRVGKALEVRDFDATSSSTPMERGMLLAAGASEPPIEGGQIEFRRSVTIIFELLP